MRSKCLQTVGLQHKPRCGAAWTAGVRVAGPVLGETAVIKWKHGRTQKSWKEPGAPRLSDVRGGRTGVRGLTDARGNPGRDAPRPRRPDREIQLHGPRAPGAGPAVGARGCGSSWTSRAGSADASPAADRSTQEWPRNWEVTTLVTHQILDRCSLFSAGISGPARGPSQGLRRPPAEAVTPDAVPGAEPSPAHLCPRRLPPGQDRSHTPESASQLPALGTHWGTLARPLVLRAGPSPPPPPVGSLSPSGQGRAPPLW